MLSFNKHSICQRLLLVQLFTLRKRHFRTKGDEKFYKARGSRSLKVYFKANGFFHVLSIDNIKAVT